MPGSGIQNHSESFVHSQTRKLPVEIWQEIFRLASSTEDTDEFMTNARSYNRTIWNRCDEENVVKAEMTPAILNIALWTRLNITRVCKAWYSMGIEILYSHVRMIPHLWDDLASQRLLQNPQLLSHTKRFTIVPPDYHRHTNVKRDVNLARIAHLCANLPQLQILDAPGDTLLFFPHQSLPTSLAVMIARGYRDYPKNTAFLPVPPDPLHTPWCNIRVLKVDLCSLDVRSHEGMQPRLAVVTFTSVVELHFNEGLMEVANGVAYISERWKFPTLHILSIICFDWLGYRGFLQAHSQMLKILSLTSYGSPFPVGDKEKIEFPELEGFYLDGYPIGHHIVAGKVTRVGWNGLVYAGVPENRKMPTEINKPWYLRRLLLTFNFWCDFPAATTYTVVGWHEILEWLEQQPVVIERVAERQKYGVTVEFIRVYGNSRRYLA